jgi:AcrR family transcriptional regulator
MSGKPVDRRVARTRQLLHGALLSLIQERGFEALSVQDIIDRANVGRATFYAHFDNKEDLLISGIEGLQASLKRQQEISRPLAFSRALFEHVDGHRAVFRAMAGKRSGAIIQQAFHKMLMDLVRSDLKGITSSGDTGPVPLEARVRLIAGGLFGLVLWWVDRPTRLTVDDVDAAFRHLAMPAAKSPLR